MSNSWNEWIRSSDFRGIGGGSSWSCDAFESAAIDICSSGPFLGKGNDMWVYMWDSAEVGWNQWQMLRLSGPTKLKGNRIHLTGNIVLDIYDDVDESDNVVEEEFTLDEPSGAENGD